MFLWFSYGFPMVFLWFSYGFPMVFLCLWHRNGWKRDPFAPEPGASWVGFLSQVVLRCDVEAFNHQGGAGFLQSTIYLYIYITVFVCMYVYIYVYIYIYISVIRSYHHSHFLGITSRFPHPNLVQGEVIDMRCSFTKETGNIEATSPLWLQTNPKCSDEACLCPGQIIQCLLIMNSIFLVLPTMSISHRTNFITPITMVCGTYNYSYWGL